MVSVCFIFTQQFGQVEAVVAALIEEYNLHRYREVVVLAVCLVMFVLGLSCVTQVMYLPSSFPF